MTRRSAALVTTALALLAGGAAWLRSGTPAPAAAVPTTPDDRREVIATRSAEVTPSMVDSTTGAEPPGADGRPAKPVTAGQEALTGSRIPAVAALSIDRQGSPREWLARTVSPERDAREAQLSALSRRTGDHVARLRERLDATADAAERARLEADIATLERNLAERRAVISPTVRDERRPFSERSR